MTFMLIGKKRCPTCCVVGKRWNKEPDVLICPTCNAYYNEFGFIVEPQIEKEEIFT